MNINLETFKNTLKIFESLCSQSNYITNIVLNMNILEIIDNILFKEIGNYDNKEKFSYSFLPMFSDIFCVLISLFPNTNLITSLQGKRENSRSKIMSEENKAFYLYFSEKILSILVNNFINMPSTITMIEVIRLIELYVIFSPKECIITYIGPVKLTNLLASINCIKNRIA